MNLSVAVPDLVVVSIAALLLAFSVAPAHADRCDLMAKQIAAKVGLKTGKRTPANIRLQPLDPDDDDAAYGAHLNCGTNGMSLKYGFLRSLGPPPRGWFVFVGQTATVLIGRDANTIAMEVQRCFEKAQALPRGSFESGYVHCDLDPGGYSLLLTER